jgi:N-acyl-D-aspartate/D-glutamate deacylase
MSRMIIRDCRVWDGSGKAAFPADLLIEGGRIRAVARNRGQLDGAGAETIEATDSLAERRIGAVPAPR